MGFYTKKHSFGCGIDLHGRSKPPFYARDAVARSWGWSRPRATVPRYRGTRTRKAPDPTTPGFLLVEKDRHIHGRSRWFVHNAGLDNEGIRRRMGADANGRMGLAGSRAQRSWLSVKLHNDHRNIVIPFDTDCESGQVIVDLIEDVPRLRTRVLADDLAKSFLAIRLAVLVVSLPNAISGDCNNLPVLEMWFQVFLVLEVLVYAERYPSPLQFVEHVPVWIIENCRIMTGSHPAQAFLPRVNRHVEQRHEPPGLENVLR